MNSEKTDSLEQRQAAKLILLQMKALMQASRKKRERAAFEN